MSTILPSLLLVLVLVLAVVASGLLWLSLRAAFGAVDPGAVLRGSVSVEQQELESERDALLGSLRELKFEWQMGKLSQDDYRQQERIFRERTREVLRLLDAAALPFRAAADELVKKSLSDRGAGSEADSVDAAADAVQEGAREVRPATARRRDRAPADGAADAPPLLERRCPKCAKRSANEAVFCMFCGAALATADAAKDAEVDADGSGVSAEGHEEP